MIVRLELFILNAMLLMMPDEDRAFVEGAVDAYEQLGLLSGAEASRWRERLADLGGPTEPRSQLDLDARTGAETLLAGMIGELTPAKRDMDAAAIERNAACNAAIWALHQLGVLDDVALRRWLSAAWEKVTPWHGGPPPFAVEPRPYALEAAVWAPPDTQEQAAQDAAHAAKAAMTARIDRVLTGGPDRMDGLAIVAVVAHAQAISVHFHYLGRLPDQISAFEAEYMRQAPDGALAPLTPPALSDDTGQIYQPVSDAPDPAGVAWVGPMRADCREAISGYWLYTPAAPPSAHTFTVERDSHSWTIQDRGS